jgi:hypothetical protein
MWKMHCRVGRPQMRIWFGACSLHFGYPSLQIHIQIFNTHCFSTAAVVARTRLIVTLYVHCLSCVILLQPGGYNDMPLITTGLQTGQLRNWGLIFGRINKLLHSGQNVRVAHTFYLVGTRGTHFHLVKSSRMCGTMPPVTHKPMWCAKRELYVDQAASCRP